MALRFSVNYPDVVQAIREYVSKTPIQIHGKTYTNLREIGKGGFGIVYDCDQGVVLKIGQVSRKEIVSEVTAMKLVGGLYIDDNADEAFFTIKHLGTRPKDVRGPVFGIVLKKMKGSVDTIASPTSNEQTKYFIGQLLFSLVRSYSILEHYRIAHNDMKPANLLYDTLPSKPYYTFHVSDFGGCVDYGSSIQTIKQIGHTYASTSTYDLHRQIRSPSEFKANETWEVTLTFLQVVLEKVLGIEWDPEEEFPDIYETFKNNPKDCISKFIWLLRDSYIQDVSCETGSFHLSVVEDILKRFVTSPDGAFSYALGLVDPSLSSVKEWGLAKIERILRAWPTFTPSGMYSRETVEKTIRSKYTVNDIITYVDEIAQAYKNAIVAQSFPFLRDILTKYLPSETIEETYESVTRVRNKVGSLLVKRLKELDPTAVPSQTIMGIVEQLNALQ